MCFDRVHDVLGELGYLAVKIRVISFPCCYKAYLQSPHCSLEEDLSAASTSSGWNTRDHWLPTCPQFGPLLCLSTAYQHILVKSCSLPAVPGNIPYTGSLRISVGDWCVCICGETGKIRMAREEHCCEPGRDTSVKPFSMLSFCVIYHMFQTLFVAWGLTKHFYL